jgi:hypothetical protein
MHVLKILFPLESATYKITLLTGPFSLKIRHRRLLPVAYWLLAIGSCLLPVAYWLLAVGSCLLPS